MLDIYRTTKTEAQASRQRKAPWAEAEPRDGAGKIISTTWAVASWRQQQQQQQPVLADTMFVRHGQAQDEKAQRTHYVWSLVAEPLACRHAMPAASDHGSRWSDNPRYESVVISGTAV